MKMPEVEYLLAYEELDKHYIVFEKNSETMLVEPIIRFVCEKQAHEYFERLGAFGGCYVYLKRERTTP